MKIFVKLIIFSHFDEHRSNPVKLEQKQKRLFELYKK